MCCEFTAEKKYSEVDMQKINSITDELKTIMRDNDISQTSVVNLLEGKCARNTVLSFFKGDADCKLSTLLMILDSCDVELRLETERSRQAILNRDIAEYREETEQLHSELSDVKENRDFYKSRYEELIEKNTSLTKTIEKQQAQIEKYMNRMETAEEALYSADEDIRRKDAKIVSLLTKLGKWE